MRILYLDLHPEYISGKTDEVLRNRGHMLFQVSTCSEALEMIRSQDFDVVVVAQDSLEIVNFIAKARGIRGELPVLLADDWGVTDLPAPSPGVRPASNCCFSIGWTTLVLRVSSPSIREETTPTIIGMYSCPGWKRVRSTDSGPSGRSSQIGVSGSSRPSCYSGSCLPSARTRSRICSKR